MIGLLRGGRQRAEESADLEPHGAVKILVGTPLTIRDEQWNPEQTWSRLVVGKEVAVVSGDLSMYCHQIFARLVRWL